MSFPYSIAVSVSKAFNKTKSNIEWKVKVSNIYSPIVIWEDA